MSSESSTDPYWFDEEAADRVCHFFERCITHTTGELAGKPFYLIDWQRDLLRKLFGWKRPDGTRRYHVLFLMIPRKNGKSTLAAGIALYLLLGDREPGAQVYSCAADREQARIVFKEAASMLRASPHLLPLCKNSIFTDHIRSLSLNATYRTLSSDAGTKHGLNPSGIIFDELHTQTSRDLYDTMHTAVGARRQPLEIYITTAGNRRHSICYDLYDYACKVRDGRVNDDKFLPVIYESLPEDDWTDPAVWAKANPNLGVSIKKDYIRDECAKAQVTPGYQNTFRQLHLNQWVEQETRWLDVKRWDEGGGSLHWNEFPEFLRGRRCFGGLDLSTTTDITANVLMFPPENDDEPWYILPKFYIPKENMKKRSQRDRLPFEEWVAMGAINATEGNMIDYRFVKNDILAMAEKYNVVEIAYDAWNSSQIVIELADEGLNMVQFRQGYGSLSAPSKLFEGLIAERKIAHGGHPILRSMVCNVARKSDPAGNIKPDKEKSRDRIDGIVAAIMGLGRATSSIIETKPVPRLVFL